MSHNAKGAAQLRVKASCDGIEQLDGSARATHEWQISRRPSSATVGANARVYIFDGVDADTDSP